ncbi:MAG: glycosyltransferase [Firmicutes bacterium]|nr:glycosyltransferase [Bacillota bacterium]
MQLVKVREKSYQDYLEYLDREVVNELDLLIERLKGKRVVMVNTTSFGGGVAEIMNSMVPLMRDMGLQVDWWTMKGEDEFFHVTKTFHNRMQGQEGRLTQKEKSIYLRYNKLNAELMQDWDYDFVVVHDPQPAALISYRKPRAGEKWIWRCHIDTSTPNPEYWDFIYDYVSQYDASIFTMEEFVKEGAQFKNLTIITPSVDPKSPKNQPLETEEAKSIITRFGVDIHRPLITQVSRFDPWKDPLGVIDAYRIVKKEFPSALLALVGSMASDDPEGWDYLYKTIRRAGEDYDIMIVTNFNGVSDLEVNAFQTASDIIIQKSLREGFGLTVSEGMWKGKPVIGGNVGGIKVQIDDGVNGFLVDTVEECAEKILTLLRNPMLAESMGEAGKEKVRHEFLLITNVLRYLRLFHSLTTEQEGVIAPAAK